jgi:hypothetical protein
MSEHGPVASRSARLSGWFRLWVVIGALYALVLAVYSAIYWPQAESRIKTHHVKDNATGVQVEVDYFGDYGPTDLQLEAIGVIHSFLGKPDGTEATFKPELADALYSLDYTKVEGRRPVYFVNGAEERVGRAIKRRADGPWPERLVWLGQGAIVWAVPMAFVYALGWSVGWVARGFRQ